jgi:hypothetical protein
MESLRLFEKKILLEELGTLEFVNGFFILLPVKISDTHYLIISYSRTSFARSQVASFASIEFVARNSGQLARSGEGAERAKKWPAVEDCSGPQAGN